MPEPQVVFIDPKAALGDLLPKAVATLDPNLGPSGPHVFDDDVSVEAPGPVGVGQPPVVSAHYTDVLDDLWAAFDEPEERTAGRLRVLLEEVADEAQRVFTLAQELWNDWPNKFKIPDSERERYDKEFLAYLRRLNGYRDILEDLGDESTATHDVYVGLVKRRQGAGPVPDAIMHMYFAQQIGILAEHAHDMGKGFIGRVLDTLPALESLADDVTDAIGDKSEDIADGAAGAFKKAMRPWLIVGGVVSSIALGLLGIVVVDRVTGRDP